MTAPMDQASELMFWGHTTDPGVEPPGLIYGRRLGKTTRPLMAHAFGVDWEVADQLKERHDLVGIASACTFGADYDTYMASSQVRNHVWDIGEPVDPPFAHQQPRRFPYPVC